VPGQGTIAWERFMAVLGQVDFRGSLILELAGDRPAEVEVILSEARDARAFLRSLGARLERTQAGP
jgi:sugar phosphate isomerase/epimerase